MNRRGQGISINMLIITAIALIVLVVSIMLYIQSTNRGKAALNDCSTLGGSCVAGVPDTTSTTGAQMCDASKGQSRAIGTCNDATGKPTGQICCFVSANPNQ